MQTASAYIFHKTLLLLHSLHCCMAVLQFVRFSILLCVTPGIVGWVALSVILPVWLINGRPPHETRLIAKWN